MRATLMLLILAAWLLASVIFAFGWFVGVRVASRAMLHPRPWREFLATPDDA